ncbi:MAG: Crp/Fnr family transcriptional regulator [Thermoguttaceae bacterium]|jgi:CRP-like cAMP-binding protein
MANIAELIRQFINIPDASPETMAEVEKICEVKIFSADDIIHREHEHSRYLYIVISGQVDIQYLLQDGRRKTLDTCMSGDYLLWSALIEPHQTNSIGIARTTAELLQVDGKRLLEICARDTDFGFRMMSLIASVIRRRLQAARYQLSFHTL